MTIISKERLNQLTQQFPKLRPLLVAGDIGIDKYTYGEVRRISPEAPVPVLEVANEWIKLGLGANISDNLKALGVKSTLCGILGNDVHASTFERLVEERGLKTWGLVRAKNRATIFKERVTTQAQQICRIDYESTTAIEEETSSRLLGRIDDFADDHQAIILQDYGKGTLSEKILKTLIAKFREQQQLVCIDPHRNTPTMFYKGASLLKPNFIESQHLVMGLGYREEKIEKIAEILVDKLELAMLVITRGKEGMALIDTRHGEGHFQEIPTVASEVYDVSGAGDTVIALLTTGLLAQATLEEAAWLGNCGAGVVVSKKGTAAVNLQELEQFHQTLLDKL